MPLKFVSLNLGCHFCSTTNIQIVCRDVSKKARDRDKRYGTDGYKSRQEAIIYKVGVMLVDAAFNCSFVFADPPDVTGARCPAPWFRMMRRDT